MQIHHQSWMLLLLSLFVAKTSTSQMNVSVSGEQLREGQSDCFPGLFYDEQCNSCLCLNATLFGYGILCQGNQTQQQQQLLCISSDWKNPEQVIGGLCPYVTPENFTIPQKKRNGQDEMNLLICHGLNRNQTLCGKCAVNYSLAINTYDFQCLPSSQCSTKSILTYALSTFVPLTFFYMLIFILQINVAVSYMFPYVIFAQTVCVFFLPLQGSMLTVFKNFKVVEILTKLLISSYSIWTLDVLTLFMPPICINDQIDNALAISLQYIIAVYPLLMILMSYVFVQLYDHNFKLVIWAVYPVVKCLSTLHVRVDPISSLLSTFATFFFLSFSRMGLPSARCLFTMQQWITLGPNTFHMHCWL